MKPSNRLSGIRRFVDGIDATETMAQCSNCQFQNMPGITHCGRCGTSLTLRAAAIDVHPPRATPAAKAWRKTAFARGVRSALASLRMMRLPRRVELPADLPAPGLIGRLAVPGWAQIHYGQRTLGRSLLLGFGFFVLAAIACFGSTASSILLGLAFACHGLSVYDFARRSSPVFRDRAFRTLLGCGLLAILVYLPVQSLVNRFVVAIVIQQDRAPLMAGDVLLVRRAARGGSGPQVGSVVQYQIPEATVAGHLASGVAANFRIEGARIDRVLAGPGQTIEWNGESLKVDGQPSPWLPLNPQGATQPLNLSIPGDSWLILPSTDFTTGQIVVTPETWRMWSLVRTEQIEGRVIWRSWPWSRLGNVGD
jgi:signal peptidase I